MKQAVIHAFLSLSTAPTVRHWVCELQPGANLKQAKKSTEFSDSRRGGGPSESEQRASVFDLPAEYQKKEELTDGINRHAVSGVLNEFFDSSFENSNHDVKLVTTCMALRNWWRTSPKHMFYSRYTIHRHNLLVVDYPYILLIFRRLGISGHCKRSSTQRFDNRFLSIQSGNHTGGGTTSRFRISPDTYI